MIFDPQSTAIRRLPGRHDGRRPRRFHCLYPERLQGGCPMVRWTEDELRQALLDLLVSKGHAHKQGSSLVHPNDHTCTLTKADSVTFQYLFTVSGPPDGCR